MSNKKFEYNYYEGVKTTLSVNEVFYKTPEGFKITLSVNEISYKTPIEGGDNVSR